MTPYLLSGHPSRPRSRACFRALALVVTALSSLMLVEAAARARGRGCRPQCQQECRRECGSLEAECGPCVASHIDLRRDCRDTVNSEVFPSCVDKRCSPGTPGHCTLTRECVDGCRASQQSQLAGCDRRFRAGIRGCQGGASCLAAERTTRRGCVGQCRHDCVASCRGGPVTTTVAPQALRVQPLVSACACQATCVNGIVSSCYDDCDDRCEGDTVALGVCRRACRDAQCNHLMKACTDDGTGTSRYALCCAQCDNCNEDLDDRFACEQATTTTRPSTTTSSTTTTTSTTSTTTP